MLLRAAEGVAVTGPGGGFDATLAAIENAAEQVARVDDALKSFQEAIAAGTALASGGAGDGPLAESLGSFGGDAKKRAQERGEECLQLSKALHESAENYRASDGGASGRIGSVSFGGVTG